MILKKITNLFIFLKNCSFSSIFFLYFCLFSFLSSFFLTLVKMILGIENNNTLKKIKIYAYKFFGNFKITLVIAKKVNSMQNIVEIVIFFTLNMLIKVSSNNIIQIKKNINLSSVCAYIILIF